jgi:hypothetical protein
MLSTIYTYSLNLPGQYTMVVRDNSSGCETRLTFNITANNAPPALDSLAVPVKTLTCDNSQVIITGWPVSINNSSSWSYPGTPGISVGNNYTVNANSATPASTIVNTYTFTTVDNSSLCKTQSVVTIYQNLFPPTAVIGIGGSSAITCSTPTVMLTNQSTSGIPPVFQHSSPVIGYLWQGPSPQAPLSNNSSYVAAVVGTYTLVAKDLNNGCTATVTRIIGDNRIYPLVNNPIAPAPTCLTGGSAIISPIITGNPLGFVYSWTSPVNATVTGVNSATLTTNTLGTYTVAVTNTISGCSTNGTLEVIDCTVTRLPGDNPEPEIKIFPNPGTGFYTVSVPTMLTGGTIEVFNIVGKLVKTFILAGDIQKIDLRDEATGIYIVRITGTNDNTVTQRILKE